MVETKGLLKGTDVVFMKFRRSRVAAVIVVFAFVVYAGFNLVSLRGRIEAVRADISETLRAVAEQELINAQLEHDILHHDDPDVKANIARNNLGLVLPGEIVLFDAGHGLHPVD